jgi:diketogulonate reductase-like aldo/keto reductase
LGSPPPAGIAATIRHRLQRSLTGLRLDHADLLFLHSNLIPDEYDFPDPESQDRFATRCSLYVNQVIPTFEALQTEGLIGAWGITGDGLPTTIRQALDHPSQPGAV